MIPTLQKGNTHKILRHAAGAAAQDDAGFRFFAWVGRDTKPGRFGRMWASAPTAPFGIGTNKEFGIPSRSAGLVVVVAAAMVATGVTLFMVMMTAGVALFVVVMATGVALFMVMMTAGVALFMVVMTAGGIGVKIQAAFCQGQGGFVRIAGNAAVNLNIRILQGKPGAAADAAADQGADTQRFQEPGQGAVAAAGGGNHLLGNDLAALHGVDLKGGGVAEVLEHLAGFVGNCNFHGFSSKIKTC
jgi:hypothetical protein